MGFNRPTWTPGHERHPLPRARFESLSELRGRRERRARENVAARELAGSLMSLAALVGSEVKDPDGRTVGKLRDVVVTWTAGPAYPPVTAIVVRAGKNDALIGARWIEASPPASIRLRSSKAYGRAVERRPADVALAHDVLDHQIVDSGGIQIVRPADVYLAAVHGRVELVGIEVGMRALLRRLGPRRLRGRVRPERVIDWGSIASFAPARDEGARARGRRAGIAGQAGAGLALGGAAADLRPMHPSEVEAALRALQSGPDGDGA
jgi:hypothetical protein